MTAHDLIVTGFVLFVAIGSVWKSAQIYNRANEDREFRKKRHNYDER